MFYNLAILLIYRNQEAKSTADQVVPTTLNLSLDQAVPEVSGTYKLRSNGRPLKINVPNFYSDGPLYLHQHTNTTAAAIPLDPLTKSTFEEIDRFILSNNIAGTYKPIAKGDRILVNFSHWCKYELMLPDGNRKIMNKGMSLGQGMYAISIAIPHLYVGPHKNGETHSVSLHICEILYEPEQNLNDFDAEEKDQFTVTF